MGFMDDYRYGIDSDRDPWDDAPSTDPDGYTDSEIDKMLARVEGLADAPDGVEEILSENPLTSAPKSAKVLPVAEIPAETASKEKEMTAVVEVTEVAEAAPVVPAKRRLTKRDRALGIVSLPKVGSPVTPFGGRGRPSKDAQERRAREIALGCTVPVQRQSREGTGRPVGRPPLTPLQKAQRRVERAEAEVAAARAALADLS